MLIVGHLVAGARAAADPSAPQLNPIHAQREDAQRLAQQHRHLDVPAADQAPQELDIRTTSFEPPRSPHPGRPAGIVLLIVGGIAGVGGLATIDGDDASVPAVLLVTAALSVTAGIALVIQRADTTVSIAPAASDHAIGFAVTARL